MADMADTAAPRIGDFQPADRKTRTPKVTSAPEDTKRTPGEDEPSTKIPMSSEERLAKKTVDAYENLAKELLPVEDYQAHLKEHGITVDEAEEIVDALMTKGYHTETVPLTKRVSVVFRTREHGDTLRLQIALEVNRPNYVHAMEELTARYSLAASLESFGQTAFAHPSPDDNKETVEKLFDVRLKFVERMADHVFYRLAQMLSKYDRKIAAVMREGVAENF